jgi:hypothetical protein
MRSLTMPLPRFSVLTLAAVALALLSPATPRAMPLETTLPADCSAPRDQREPFLCADPAFAALDQKRSEALATVGPSAYALAAWEPTITRSCSLSAFGGTPDLQPDSLSDCLKTSYDARIDTIRDLSPLSDLVPTRGLYRPHLSLDKAPALCAVFQAAEQEAFLSAEPYPTVVGKSWPGLATAWHITQPIHQAWGFADDQSMEHSIVDLDGDGTPEVIAPYPDQGHQLNTDKSYRVPTQVP